MCPPVLLTGQVRKGIGEVRLPQALWGEPETAPHKLSQLLVPSHPNELWASWSPSTACGSPCLQ